MPPNNEENQEKNVDNKIESEIKDSVEKDLTSPKSFETDDLLNFSRPTVKKSENKKEK